MQQILLCPACHAKTHTHVRSDTTLLHFPLFCPKCRRETLISFQDNIITIETNEPDASDAEPVISRK